MEFHKIDTLFKRDDKFKVTDELKHPVIDTIKLWSVTEQIDGTNIRVILKEDGTIDFGGRTSNAMIPSQLLSHLYKTFTAEKMKDAFWRHEPDAFPVVLYGEGYGTGIQKSGGNYTKNKSFRLFDVLIDNKWWLNWENTSDVASKLGIKTVPFLGNWTLSEIIANVKNGVKSIVALEESGNDLVGEGIVGRTIEPLFLSNGKRLIIKLKTSDFNKDKSK